MDSENSAKTAPPSNNRRRISATTFKAKCKLPHQKLSYALYLHREELKNSKSCFLNAASSKLTLTRELVRNALKNIDNYSAETSEILDREKLFAKKLKKRIEGKKDQLAKMEQYVKQKDQNIEKPNTSTAAAEKTMGFATKTKESLQSQEGKQMKTSI